MNSATSVYRERLLSLMHKISEDPSMVYPVCKKDYVICKPQVQILPIYVDSNIFPSSVVNSFEEMVSTFLIPFSKVNLCLCNTF